MKKRTEYLSDEELNKLILEVEQKDMVAAPPQMAENILSCVFDYQCQERQDAVSQSEDNPLFDVRKAEHFSAVQKRKEYRNYCFRVWTSVAAAIAMVFLMPKLMSLQPMPESLQSPEWPKTTERQEEILDEWIALSGDKDSKDIGIFKELLGGSNFFGKEDKYNFFNERNGG